MPNDVLQELESAVQSHRGRVLDSEFFQSGDTTVFQVEFIKNDVSHVLEFRTSRETGNLLQIKNLRTDEVIEERTVSDDPNDLEGDAGILLGQATLESTEDKAQAILEGADVQTVLEAMDAQEIVDQLDDSPVSANGRDFRIQVRAKRGKVRVQDLENLPFDMAEDALSDFRREMERRVEDTFGDEAEVTDASVTRPMMTPGDDIGNIVVTITPT